MKSNHPGENAKVAALCRLGYEGHVSELCVLYLRVLQSNIYNFKVFFTFIGKSKSIMYEENTKR